MYTITKEFSFSASHQLTDLPEEHPCSNLHGHNYVIKVELKNAVLNGVGFVYDYRGLDIIKKWIDEHLDHQHLNHVLDFNPTAENMAKDIYDHVKKLINTLSKVRIHETATGWAEYYE